MLKKITVEAALNAEMEDIRLRRSMAPVKVVKNKSRNGSTATFILDLVLVQVQPDHFPKGGFHIQTVIGRRSKRNAVAPRGNIWYMRNILLHMLLLVRGC